MNNAKTQRHRSLITLLLSMLLAVTMILSPSISALASDAFSPPSVVSVYGTVLEDRFNDVKLTPDGGYVAVGFSYRPSTGGDALIVKFNAGGTVQWSQYYGRAYSDHFNGVAVVSDGYIAVGRVDSENNDNNFKAVIVKYDLDGNSVWTKNYQCSSYDGFEDICVTSDGGFIASGRLDSSSGPAKGFLVKYDTNSNIEWITSTSLGENIQFSSVKQTMDGGYITSGYTVQQQRYCLAKFDAQGNRLWYKEGPAGAYHHMHSIAETPDGYYIGVGDISSISNPSNYPWLTPGGFSDAFIMKFTQTGNMVWAKALSGNYYDYYYDVNIQSDGNILVTGHSRSTNIGIQNIGFMDTIVVKYDLDGNILALGNYGGTKNDESYCMDVENNKIVLAGESASSDGDIPSNKGNYDAYVLTISLIDKNSLSELIASVQNVNENDYTPASWADFAGALSVAIAVDADPDATAAEIDAAIAGLQAAYNALVPRPDKTSLAIAINQAAGLNKAYYTNASWNSMLGGLNTAYSVYDNPNASQAEVDDAYNQLSAAVSALQPALNKGALGLTIKSALNLSGSNYTAESWSQMRSKLQAAVAIYNELPGERIDYQTQAPAPNSITQDTIDAANAELLNAMVALEGNKRDIIASIVEKAQEVDSSQFTPDTWVLFSNVLSRAAAVGSDPDTTDEEISQHLERLSNALIGIKGAISLPDTADTYIINDSNDKAYIYGTVDAAILSAEVTLSSFFHIAPNAPEGERFISPDISIVNTSTMPISVSAVSFKATSSAPKVVAPNMFSDVEWSELGLADTKAYIAMGYTGAKTGDFFFAAEGEQSERALGTLDSFEPMALGLQSKFGLSWDKSQTFKYESVFSLALLD